MLARVAGNRRNSLLPSEDLERHDEADTAPRSEQRELGKQRHETRALEHHAAQGVVERGQGQRLHQQE